jgi:hypothetical protein
LPPHRLLGESPYEVNAPEKVTIAPLAKDTDRLYDCPALGAVAAHGLPAAEYVAVTTTPTPVAGTLVAAATMPQDFPEYVMVTLVPVRTEAVPLFAKVTVPVVVAAAELNTALVIVTLAVLPALPKIPNTYPATAANAMSVAATMRTVATIGEIARL